MKNRVCIMARVNKQSGDYQRQVDELVQYANEKEYQVVEIIIEKIGGGIKNVDRPDILRMLELVSQKKIDKVFAS